MRPQDLLKKTILAQANRTNSDFEDITHRGVTVRAKVEYGDFRKAGETDLGDRTLEDEISFLNVSIPSTTLVSRGDEITCGDKTYEISYFSKVISDVYNIFATRKLRSGSMR
jgi:hypothetical protein